MTRRTVVVTVGLLLLLPWGSPAAAGSACPEPERGVTVVVDFRAAGGGIEVGCAPGTPGSGFAAMVAAGFDLREVTGLPGFLCTIDGLPATEDCADTPPADAFWSYWYAERGGVWSYSLAGGAARTPPPGSVDGWAFGAGTAPGVAPPEPTPVPAATTTTTTTTTSTVPPATTTTKPPTTTTTETPAVTTTFAPTTTGTPGTTTSQAEPATTTTVAATTTTTSVAMAESADGLAEIPQRDRSSATIVAWGALGLVGVAGVVTAARRRTRL